MKILKSKKMELPPICFVTDRKELESLPIGVPYIYGLPVEEKYILTLLEYQILYKNALETKLPFDWELILTEAGFKNTIPKEFDEDSYFDISGEESSLSYSSLENYVNNYDCVINLDKLKALYIIPTFFQNLEKSIEVNLHNFTLYNPYLYSKKLDGVYGGLEPTGIDRNLIIIDISGSIPQAITASQIIFAKTLTCCYYADLLVTGSKTILINYNDVINIDVEELFDKIGRNNDQAEYKALVSERRIYNNVICFGDNDNPGEHWKTGDKRLSDREGQKINNWEVNHLISLHTTSNVQLAGYCRWFTPNSIEHISDWVHYIKQ